MDISIATQQVAANPRMLVDILNDAAPVDLIVGPSGYGIPWLNVRDLTPRKMKRMLLSRPRDHGRDTIIGGMTEILEALKESGLPICFAPGVIHLESVPSYRKVNRIDMGTADKLCAVALGVYDQAHRLDIDYAETSFIYLELGGAFTAAVAVENGRIVDGLGGTSGPLGYLSLGTMDGELAYLLGSFPKELLCSGGTAYIAGQSTLTPQKFASSIRSDPRCAFAWEAFMDSLLKCVAAETTVVSEPREILLSGRLSRIPELKQELTRRLSSFASVRLVSGFAETAKEAAQGAALIAEGLAGGMHKKLIEAMELRQAGGDVLDHLFIEGAKTYQRNNAA